MVKQTACSDPATYAMLQDIGYVMAEYGLKSLPLDIIENWPRVSDLDHLLDEGILVSNGRLVQINLPQYQTIISEKVSEKLGVSLPNELQDCLGPPWDGPIRPLVNCTPKLSVLSSGQDTYHEELISLFVRKTTLGEGATDYVPKSLENVIVIPVFHERDYKQYAKVKRAFAHYKPDFVGIEGLGHAATRYLISSLFTARSFIGLPYCAVFKPYVYNAERVDFFVKHYKETRGTKSCIATENDFAIVASICMGQSVPFFTMGIPEECLQDDFPEFHKNEKEAWENGCCLLESQAKQRFENDLDVLCNRSKIEEMEKIVLRGRIEAFSKYKEQLIWCENYMASRIYDFCKIAGFDNKVLVFVGICHSKTLRDKLENGSWRYIPPINERRKKIPQGFAPSKIAAYLLLEDPTSLSFVSRFERSIAPSPIHAEFFGLKEDDVIKLVDSNLKGALVINNDEEIAKRELVEEIIEYCQTNPKNYARLRKLAEDDIRKNGLNGRHFFL